MMGQRGMPAYLVLLEALVHGRGAGLSDIGVQSHLCVAVAQEEQETLTTCVRR